MQQYDTENINQFRSNCFTRNRGGDCIGSLFVLLKMKLLLIMRCMKCSMPNVMQTCLLPVRWKGGVYFATHKRSLQGCMSSCPPPPTRHFARLFCTASPWGWCHVCARPPIRNGLRFFFFFFFFSSGGIKEAANSREITRLFRHTKFLLHLPF